MTSTRGLKIAIVGTGNVAQRNYLPYLADEADVSLGYYNRTLEKARECAQEFGGTAFDALTGLMDWQPDAVLILTREMDRCEAARAVLELGPGRVFFEKPLVARYGQEKVTEQDFLDGRELLQTAAARGCETAMVFNYRFFEHSAAAKEMIEERDFGKVLEITGLVHYACWSHCIDLVHFFAGPVAEVSALQSHAARGSGGLEAEDVAVAFRTEGDAAGALLGTAGMDFEFPLFEMTFNFERGRIRLQDLDGDLEVMAADTGEVERYGIARGRSRWDLYNASFAKSLDAYLESIRQNRAPPVPGVAGLLELQFEAGLRRSASEGRPAVLRDDFPLEVAG